jgi:hypothetical protein
MLSAIMLSAIMLSAIMLSVVMLSVVMLSVAMLSVVMLNVVAPLLRPSLQWEYLRIFDFYISNIKCNVGQSCHAQFQPK